VWGGARINPAGSGLHHSLDPGQSAEIDLAFLRLPGVFTPAAPGAQRGVVPPGVALLESLSEILAERHHPDGDAGGAGALRRVAAGGLLTSTLPALLRGERNTVRQHEWRLRTTADERRTWYYDWLLTSHEAASERAVIGLARGFSPATPLWKRLAGRKVPACPKPGRSASSRPGALALLAGGASLLWMAWRAIARMDHAGRPGAFFIKPSSRAWA